MNICRLSKSVGELLMGGAKTVLLIVSHLDDAIFSKQGLQIWDCMSPETKSACLLNLIWEQRFRNYFRNRTFLFLVTVSHTELLCEKQRSCCLVLGGSWSRSTSTWGVPSLPISSVWNHRALFLRNHLETSVLVLKKIQQLMSHTDSNC